MLSLFIYIYIYKGVSDLGELKACPGSRRRRLVVERGYVGFGRKKQSFIAFVLYD